MLKGSARLLHTLSLLQRQRFWTGPALAEALGITERSVRREIDRLRAQGYPVNATPGVGGGYALGAGADLPPLPLDDDEALAVAVGLRAAAAGVVGGLETAAVRALAKLEQVLPQRLRSRMASLEAVSVQLPFGGARVDGAVLAAFARASRTERQIRFDYVARDGAATARWVEPYRLVHSALRWYLLAYDLERRDWRTFRVDRARSPRLDAPFRPRPLPDPDVAAWVAGQLAPETPNEFVSFQVRCPPERLATLLTGEPVVASDDPAFSTVRVAQHRVPWIAAWLALEGHTFTVEAPAALRAHLAEAAARLAAAVAPP